MTDESYMHESYAILTEPVKVICETKTDKYCGERVFLVAFFLAFVTFLFELDLSGLSKVAGSTILGIMVSGILIFCMILKDYVYQQKGAYFQSHLEEWPMLKMEDKER